MKNKTFKGTPGPWRQYKNDSLRICGADDSDVAEVLAEDDARLIAAAPELLESLMELVETFTPQRQSIYSFAQVKIDYAKSIINMAIGNE